jgi:predicted GNAT family N-acyltransferase
MMPVPITHTIPLATNESITYTLRSLSNDQDITKWTKFCASIFSYKDNPPPPSYFSRHFYNDPRRDLDLVRVLVYTNEDGQEEIVSSVRIFRRSLTIPGGTSIEAGGIGEVCTSPNHQRRGLSKILLNDALEIMRGGDSGMSCSLLHASPAFRPVYAKVGYECVTSRWSVLDVKLDQLSTEVKGPYESTCTGETVEWAVRSAVFPSDTPQLHELHQFYSEDTCITVKRTEQYWNDYVSQELCETLWVLVKTTAAAETIVAWLAIRKRGDRYQLREFGHDKSDDFTIAAAMRHLLGKTLQQAEELSGSISLHLPTVVLDDIKESEGDCSFMDVQTATEENDDGWMYVNFDATKSNVLDLARREDDRIDHLVWPTDSF